MAVHVERFLDQYIQSMKDAGMSFPVLEIQDEVMDTEAMTRERLEPLARDLFEQSTLPVLTADGNVTLGGGNCLLLCDGSGGGFTVTLADASECPGARVVLKRVDSSAAAVSVATNIDGVSGWQVRDTISLVSDGAAWLTTAPVQRRGSSSVTTSSTVTVSVSPAMRTSDYVVCLMMKGDPNASWWVDNRTTTSFRVNFDVSTTVSFEWSV